MRLQVYKISIPLFPFIPCAPYPATSPAISDPERAVIPLIRLTGRLLHTVNMTCSFTLNFQVEHCNSYCAIVFRKFHVGAG